MKKLFLSIFASCILLGHAFAQMATLTVPDVNGVSGNTTNVPVTISGIDGSTGGTPVIGIQVKVTYLTTVVSYLGVTNLNTTLATVGTWNPSTLNGGTVVVFWEATDLFTPVSLADGSTLFEMTFNANNGGTSPLALVDIEVIDGTGMLIPTTLDDGSITYPAPAPTSTWNGSGSWYQASNWDNGIPAGATNAIINSGVIAADNTHLNNKVYCHDLTINPKAGVTVNTGIQLVVSGNLLLESYNTQEATGSILINGTLSVAGTSTVKRWINGYTNHFISTPIAIATIQNFYNPANTGFFYRYNEPTQVWDNPWQLNYQLNLASGYLVNYYFDQMISISGVINNEASYGPTLTRTSGWGWNLVGNPYPCPVDWDLGSGWTKTNLDNAIYIYNPALNTYASYVNGVGNNGGSCYIPQFQGFFVHANGTPTFAVKKAARTQDGNNTPYFKETPANVFKLALGNTSGTDEMTVYLHGDATPAFDGEMDAYKLFNQTQTIPYIYSRINEIDFAINGLPLSDVNVIPVVVNTLQAGDYAFTASGFESFDPAYSFILEDLQTGLFYNMKQNSGMSLTLNEGETTGRFNLHITKGNLGIDNTTPSAINIYSIGDVVYIEHAPQSDVSVYNMVGDLMMRARTNGNELSTLTLQASPGVYLVTVVSGEKTVTGKIIINN